MKVLKILACKENHPGGYDDDHDVSGLIDED